MTEAQSGGGEQPAGVTVRRAGADDVEPLVGLMTLDPSREALAMAGTADAAARFRVKVMRHALETGTSVVFVAEAGPEPLGFAEISSAGDLPPLRLVARSAVAAMGFPGALAAAWRSYARLRVDLPVPKGGVHLAELQVSPHHRNRGVGGLLLTWVDGYAVEQGAAHASLTTTIDNPARRLYERNGYRVVATKTNARYERITGSAGRVLMVKTQRPNSSDEFGADGRS